MSQSPTTTESQEQKLDAHIIAFRNNEYYKTSKVVIDYNGKNQRVKDNLEELKRELTYESNNHKALKVSFLHIKETFENRIVYDLKIIDDFKPVTKEDHYGNYSYQSETIHKSLMEKIEKVTGCKFDNFTYRYYKTDMRFLSKESINDETLEITISFSKRINHKPNVNNYRRSS